MVGSYFAVFLSGAASLRVKTVVRKTYFAQRREGLRLGPEFLRGDYVLQVVVTDQLGKQKQNIISQWIDFEVVK